MTMNGFLQKTKDVFFSTEDITYRYATSDIDSTKAVCVAAYIPVLFFLPLVAAKGSPVGRFHAGQGLLITLFSIIASIVSNITFIGGIISWVMRIALVVAVVMAIVNTGNGKVKRLPLIGNIELIK